MPHGRHIYAKAYDMAKATMCTYPQSDNALPHWKCVLQCCSDCQCINLTDQETDKKHEETTPSTMFYIYHIIVSFTANGIIILKGKTYVTCVNNNLFQMDIENIYTIKQLLMMETNISDFHTRLYIPSIQNLALCLPHVHMIGTNHCGEILRTAFKQRELFQDVRCLCYYAERLVESFSNQIQS